MTRNGNVAQGAFSPYGNNWSVYFDGASILTVLRTNALNLEAGRFTIECWVKPTSISSRLTLISDRTNQDTQWELYHNAGKFCFGNTSTEFLASPSTYANGSWYHIAVTRNAAGESKLFVNGILVASATISVNFTSTTIISVGSTTSGSNKLIGYISNARVVKGADLYTENFTPGSMSLEAVSGTSLLMCKSNRLADVSSSNAAVTVTGTPKITKLSPFVTSAYGASTDGGSVFFDGSTSLSIPSNSAFSLAGDYTIAAWAYLTATGTYANVIAGNGNAGSFTMEYSSNRGFVVSVAGDVNGNFPAVVYQWVHLAVTRSGSTVRTFANGVQTTSNTISGSVTAQALGVGAYSSGGSRLTGYLSDVCIFNTALWTSSFTPPTVPIPVTLAAKLMLRGANSGIIDVSQNNNIETLGNAKVSTDVFKYDKSITINGSSDALKMRDLPVLQLRENNFTVESWFRWISSDESQPVLCTLNSNSSAYTALAVRIDSSRRLCLTMSTTGSSWAVNTIGGSSGPVLSLDTWYHFAVTRSGSVYTLYLNGESIAAGAIIGTLYSGTINLIGTDVKPTSIELFRGNFEDFRVINGSCIYETAFTPAQIVI